MAQAMQFGAAASLSPPMFPSCRHAKPIVDCEPCLEARVQSDTERLRAMKAKAAMKGVRCDICGSWEPKGKRYKCVVCADWDMCQSCHAADRYHTEHALLEIRHQDQEGGRTTGTEIIIEQRKRPRFSYSNIPLQVQLGMVPPGQSPHDNPPQPNDPRSAQPM